MVEAQALALAPIWQAYSGARVVQAAMAALRSAAALPQEMLLMILGLVEIYCCKAQKFSIIL